MKNNDLRQNSVSLTIIRQGSRNRRNFFLPSEVIPLKTFLRRRAIFKLRKTNSAPRMPPKQPRMAVGMKVRMWVGKSEVTCT